MFHTSMDKLFLLCHKNLIILRRRWISSILIILLPGFVSLVLLIVRAKTPRHLYPTPTQWNSFTANALPYSKIGWTLGYTPKSGLTDDIMVRVKKTTAADILPFPDESQMLAYLDDQLDGVAGIVFHETKNEDRFISYSIRMHSSTSWETRLLYPRFPIVGPRSSSASAEPPNYVSTGFLAIQQAVDSAIIGRVTELINATLRIPIHCTFKRLPYPAHLEDPFTMVIEQQLSLLIVIGFLFPAVYLVKRILEEKSSKIKVSLFCLSIAFCYIF